MAWRRRRCRPAPSLPFVLRSHFTLADGPPAVSREAPVRSPSCSPTYTASRRRVWSAMKPLKIGVVLSGGQAPGGHNVIFWIFGCGRSPATG